MKASLQWMNEYVPIDMNRPPQELADILTQAGIPVEDVESMNKGIEKVYTGKIVKVEAHPDADKLVVCMIECIEEDGTPSLKQIVTGAPNVKAGQIVPVAYHKSTLPDKHIKKGKLRGVMSEGMLCSINELGISKDVFLPELAEGILILPEDTPIGVDIKDVLLLNDVVYEFELTPNRADCFSMVGLSREFAVMTGEKATFPSIEAKENGSSIEGKVQISIEDTELCTRFAARLITNLKVGPSPVWMQNRLRNSGIRPINSIVDVTNYVMIELGQPMHAYDYDFIKGKHLTARRAVEGEVLKTLDGNERTLAASMLVIADEERAVGVAGVMGGFDSEVTDKTTSVLLESAVFKGSSIRRTARALGMRSEASGRYERGVNPEYSILALDRAAQLLQEMDENVNVAEGIIDVYPSPMKERSVSFTVDQINKHLGTDLSAFKIISILESLEFVITAQENILHAAVPSWRDDVTGMPDIAEEVARIYGYDNIQPTLPLANLNGGTMSEMRILKKEVNHYLAQAGMTEVITFSFMHPNNLQSLQIPETDSRYMAVPIINPITEDFPVMRTSLVPGMLEAAHRNLANKNNSLWLFEEAAVYEPKSLPVQDFVNERQMVCGLLLGKANSPVWPNAQRESDFYDAKGIVEGLLNVTGLKEWTVSRSNTPYLHPGISAVFAVNDQIVATVGELHPQVAKNYDLPSKTIIFEIDLNILIDLPRVPLRYQSISKFPGTTRDLAIVAPVAVAGAEIMTIIKAEGGEYLVNTYLFDVYEGQNIAKGYRSLAYSLEFRSTERTLTDGDIEDNMNQIIARLSEKGCSLR